MKATNTAAPCPGLIPFGNGRFLKDANRETIVRYVRQMPGISRTGLSEQAGLAKATVSDLVGELIADGWLAESEFVGRRNAGRLPRPLELDARRRRLIGCQINDKQSVVTAMTLAGDVSELSVSSVGSSSPATILDVLGTQISDVCRKLALRNILISGIGLAVPGPVHPLSGELLFSDCPGWQHLPIRDLFADCLKRRKLSDMPILVGRAMNCVAQYHFESEGAATEEPVLYIDAGHGVGASVIVHGLPLMGLNGCAGAISHMEVEPGGAACECGKRGCANATVTLRAMEQRLGLTEAELRQRYAARDKRVTAVVEETAVKLADLIHDLCLAYDPARLFVSGNAFKLGAQFQAVVRNRVEYMANNAGRDFPRMKVVRLDAHDGAHGAAMLMLNSSLGLSICAGRRAPPGAVADFVSRDRPSFAGVAA